MTAYSAAALAGALFLLAVSPGPGVFATTARALASGFRRAALLAAGMVLGDLIFLLLAIYGLAAVAEVLGDFFAVVRFAGAGYLLWLGYRLWTVRPSGTPAGRPPWIRTDFLSGLVITLGNPKVILFYLGFLPTFLDLGHLSGAEVLLAVTIVVAVLGSVLLGYALAASRVSRHLRSPRSMRNLNRASGTAMIGVGLALMVKT